MDQHYLISHPEHPPAPGVSLSVAYALVDARLTIEYRVVDPAGAILWPPAAEGRADNLWQHTCFEAFIGSASSNAYAEFNCSPSGAWAAYAFDDYRADMRELEVATPPQIGHVAPGLWRASIDLTGLDAIIGPTPWRLALTAVVEKQGGSKSYWSLSHPPGKPDFHHADCFAARLG